MDKLLSLSTPRSTATTTVLPIITGETPMTRFIDHILDFIIKFEDYFLIRKHITLSESALFMLSLGRCLWFTLFGVQMGSFSGPVTHAAWTPIFWMVTIAHFLSFFGSLTVRIGAVILQAFLWSVLSILIAFGDYHSPALPTFIVFTFTAAFIAVRLMRDNRQ